MKKKPMINQSKIVEFLEFFSHNIQTLQAAIDKRIVSKKTAYKFRDYAYASGFLEITHKKFDTAFVTSEKGEKFIDDYNEAEWFSKKTDKIYDMEASEKEKALSKLAEYCKKKKNKIINISEIFKHFSEKDKGIIITKALLQTPNILLGLEDNKNSIQKEPEFEIYIKLIPQKPKKES